jgi:hypothetical protein
VEYVGGFDRNVRLNFVLGDVVLGVAGELADVGYVVALRADRNVDVCL